jgi:hypothetical protein
VLVLAHCPTGTHLSSLTRLTQLLFSARFMEGPAAGAALACTVRALPATVQHLALHNLCYVDKELLAAICAHRQLRCLELCSDEDEATDNGGWLGSPATAPLRKFNRIRQLRRLKQVVITTTYRQPLGDRLVHVLEKALPNVQVTDAITNRDDDWEALWIGSVY